MSNYLDVGKFHTKFGLHSVNEAGAGPTGAETNEELMQFRVKFMEEELQEFIDCLASGDIAGMADALIDLVYVAEGTGHLLGLPWEDLWANVQKANMAKVRALTDGSNSKRGSSYDVVKPEGWQPPDGATILRQYGFDS